MGSTSFWSDQSIEPKRKSRFILSLGGIEHWIVKSGAKPSFDINVTEHTYLNHKFYYPGTVTWNEIEVTLVDPLRPDSSATMYQVLLKSGYIPPTSQGEAESGTVSKKNATEAMNQVTIQHVGAGGINDILDTWTLQNTFVSRVNWGDLSYEDDSLVDIVVGLRYDFATYESTSSPSSGTE